MIHIIRAHFDGKVIVPDEPVDLPVNQPLRVQVLPSVTSNGEPDAEVIRERLERLRSTSGIISAPSLPESAFDRENLYDERL